MKLSEVLLEGPQADRYMREVLMGLTRVLHGKFTKNKNDVYHTEIEVGDQPIVIVNVRLTIWGSIISMFLDPFEFKKQASEISDQVRDAINKLPMMSKEGAKVKFAIQAGHQNIYDGTWIAHVLHVTYPKAQDVTVSEHYSGKHDDWYVIDGQKKILDTYSNVHGALASADRHKKAGRQAKAISRVAFHSKEEEVRNRIQRREKEQFEKHEAPWLEEVPYLDSDEIEELANRSGSIASLGEIADVNSVKDSTFIVDGKRVASKVYMVVVKYDPADMGIDPNTELYSDPTKVTIYRSPANPHQLKIRVL